MDVVRPQRPALLDVGFAGAEVVDDDAALENQRRDYLSIASSS
jgi:hypothetical protein